ncbi:hypothetical protein GOBAR_AA06046 [Gossypium barbadense]|uniref:Uncharacterized protein n=1 Tax=Gossypium barbadense TaxID=3634 RepID=A0A2P5YG13_GOSBA|nr:hypothetical protein GOBAR_AA06046 [Gossypium barbadense]
MLMAVEFLLMALAMPSYFYIGSTVVGICCLVRLVMNILVASELFSLNYYGLQHFNPQPSNRFFFFLGLLAGYLYEAQAIPTLGGENNYVGAYYYAIVYIIMAIASLIGFSLDVLLVIKTKNIYTNIFNNWRSMKSLASWPTIDSFVAKVRLKW